MSDEWRSRGFRRKQRDDIRVALEAESAKAVAHGKRFIKIDRFIRARIAEGPHQDELTAQLEALYGRCDVTGFGVKEPIFVFCAPDDFGEMLEFARLWGEHPDYPT